MEENEVRGMVRRCSMGGYSDMFELLHCSELQLFYKRRCCNLGREDTFSLWPHGSEFCIASVLHVRTSWTDAKVPSTKVK